MENKNQWEIKSPVAILCVVVVGLLVGGAWFWPVPVKQHETSNSTETSLVKEVTIPIVWDDLGAKLIATGVIDREKWDEVYNVRGGLPAGTEKLVYGGYKGPVVMTENNAGVMLNLLWAFGLANKSSALTDGPMQSGGADGAGQFASTGGWGLGSGDPMDHYNQHTIISLSPAQQDLVNKVAKNIYRPCCNNSTYFPDCNHGMAMLGLLELLAANGVKEDEMYRVALAVNGFWFPDNYETIDLYLKANGSSLAKADPKEILGVDYSSASGYGKVAAQVVKREKSLPGGCSF
ncbi:MAG: hypothetical protein AAB821_03470 [Patescibacteria group bacterium]